MPIFLVFLWLCLLTDSYQVNQSLTLAKQQIYFPCVEANWTQEHHAKIGDVIQEINKIRTFRFLWMSNITQIHKPNNGVNTICFTQAPLNVSACSQISINMKQQELFFREVEVMLCDNFNRAILLRALLESVGLKNSQESSIMNLTFSELSLSTPRWLSTDDIQALVFMYTQRTDSAP